MHTRTTGGHALTSAYPTRRSDLRARTVEGEVVVLDGQRQLVHQLNRTGGYIWDRCDGAHSVAMIARDVAQAFDVDAEAAENDVVNAVCQLETAGLVDIRAPGAQTHDELRRVT
jgi:hypothetical protein